VAPLRLISAALALAVAAPLHAAPVDQWRPLISDASARFGVPEDWIIRVIAAESRGRGDAVSRKGAMGLMQLMPGTWADMRSALRLGSDPFDPHDNIVAGTAYLRLLYDRFGYPGLFAAYNAGPQRYAELLAGKRALPLETRLYVATVAGPAPSLFAVGTGTPATVTQPPRGEAGLFFALSTSPLRQ
jgi:soluble lytic murein transglycosylase-like protein